MSAVSYCLTVPLRSPLTLCCIAIDPPDIVLCCRCSLHRYCALMQDIVLSCHCSLPGYCVFYSPEYSVVLISMDMPYCICNLYWQVYVPIIISYQHCISNCNAVPSLLSPSPRCHNVRTSVVHLRWVMSISLLLSSQSVVSRAGAPVSPKCLHAVLHSIQIVSEVFGRWGAVGVIFLAVSLVSRALEACSLTNSTTAVFVYYYRL